MGPRRPGWEIAQILFPWRGNVGRRLVDRTPESAGDSGAENRLGRTALESRRIRTELGNGTRTSRTRSPTPVTPLPIFDIVPSEVQ